MFCLKVKGKGNIHLENNDFICIDGNAFVPKHPFNM